MAESFGVHAKRYDRARLRLSRRPWQRIVAASAGGEVLDVGCGTGIAARQFQGPAALYWTASPGLRMAEFARQSGIEVECGCS